MQKAKYFRYMCTDCPSILWGDSKSLEYSKDHLRNVVLVERSQSWKVSKYRQRSVALGDKACFSLWHDNFYRVWGQGFETEPQQFGLGVWGLWFSAQVAQVN